MFDKQLLARGAIKAGLLLLVLLLFLAHAAGLFDIQQARTPTITFNNFWAVASDGVRSLPLQKLLSSADFILLIFTGLLLCLALPLLSPLWASLLTLLVIIPPVYGNYAGLFSSPLVPMEYQLLTIMMLFVVNVLFSYFEENHEKQKVMETFGHYVPPQIVNKICRDPKQISLDGESRHMSVMFSDLKNFSSVAEELNPRQLTRLLNEYFTAMTRVLHDHDATIDKFIGDAIMTFWGAPLSQPDHAQRAIAAAFDMHREIAVLTGKFQSRGWPAPEMYIGINTGLMNVGNMGTQFRISYTVIGDAVNVAARLQEQTRDYRVPTIASEATVQAADRYLYRTLDDVLLKGRHRKLRIYEPLGEKASASPETLAYVDRHEQAIALLLGGGETEKATEALAALQAERPDDAYYTRMLEKLGAREPDAPSSPAPQEG